MPRSRSARVARRPAGRSRRTAARSRQTVRAGGCNRRTNSHRRLVAANRRSDDREKEVLAHDLLETTLAVECGHLVRHSAQLRDNLRARVSPHPWIARRLTLRDPRTDDPREQLRAELRANLGGTA